MLCLTQVKSSRLPTHFLLYSVKNYDVRKKASMFLNFILLFDGYYFASSLLYIEQI